VLSARRLSLCAVKEGWSAPLRASLRDHRGWSILYAQPSRSGTVVIKRLLPAPSHRATSRSSLLASCWGVKGVSTTSFWYKYHRPSK
jgi:hypothetical protein